VHRNIKAKDINLRWGKNTKFRRRRKTTLREEKLY
jgi:hypothetical protein